MRKTVLSVAVIATVLSTPSVFAGNDQHGAHWGYEGHGAPEHWGDLGKEFTTCKTGQSQSPVNIDTKTASRADLPPIKFDYKPATVEVVNNGHTIQVNYPKGSTISVGDKRYELLQFHFHSPSEHTINGKPADMVVHLVHKSDKGELGVVGVKMDKGESHPALAQLWPHLPKASGQSVKLEKVSINAADLLPDGDDYYAYSGSLTTPPCTEGVNWMVMADRVSVSPEQLATFKGIFPMNARPVQPLYKRAVKAVD